MAQDSIKTVPCHKITYDLKGENDSLTFDEAQIEKLKQQDAFDYTVYKAPDTIWTQFKTWLSQLWRKFIKWLFDIDEITGFWAGLLQILPYLLIIAIFLLMIWLFMKVNPKDILLEKSENPEILFTEDEEIIQNKNIEELIITAIAQKNYRLAIRYYYLGTLKKLKEKDFIIWESQKTNSDYLMELPNLELKKHFKNITKLYDFIWYGSFEIDEPSFHKAEKAFISMNKEIS